MGTTLMSEEERRFMWHVAWFLDQKCPEAVTKRTMRFVRLLHFTVFSWGLDMTLVIQNVVPASERRYDDDY